MLVRIYGARGSIPVASAATTRYSGNTTCLYVESGEHDAVAVDAGTGIRELGLQFVKNNVTDIHLLFTHYHWDHLQGFPFFVPAFVKDTNLTIYGPSEEVDVKTALTYQMSLPYFPTVTMADLPAQIHYRRLRRQVRIGPLQIRTIPNNHPNFTLGLKFTEKNRSFVFLTDNELTAPNPRTRYKQFVDFIKGAEMLIHDAQYDKSNYGTKIGWGHSTYEDVMQLALDADVKHLVFTHHDPASTDEYIDGMIARFRRQYPDHHIEAARTGMEIQL